MRLRAGSAIRGAGVGLACLLPRLSGRAGAVGAAYAVGWPMGRPGLQLLVWVPEEDEPTWRSTVVPFASSALSWTTVMVLAASGVRRTKLPAPVAAVLLGGLVAVGDSLLTDVGARAMAKAEEFRAAAGEQRAAAEEQAAD